jgi:hypothetical protein
MVNGAEFQEDYEAMSPYPVLSVSQQRIAGIVISGFPGVGLCLAALFLWTASRRHEQTEEIGEQALDSWSRNAFEAQVESWLEGDRWPGSRPPGVDRLVEQLAPAEKLRLVALAETSRWGLLEAPQVPITSPPRTAGIFWWMAGISAWGVALVSAIGVVVTMFLIPKMAEVIGMEVPITTVQARGGLVMGLGLAMLPAMIGVMILACIFSRRFKAKSFVHLRHEVSHDVLKTTRNWLIRVDGWPDVEERCRVCEALIAAALPVLLPEHRAELENLSSRPRDSKGVES